MGSMYLLDSLVRALLFLIRRFSGKGTRVICPLLALEYAVILHIANGQHVDSFS